MVNSIGWMSVVTGINYNIRYANNDVSVPGRANICKPSGTTGLDALCAGSIVMIHDGVLVWIEKAVVFSFYALGLTVAPTTWDSSPSGVHPKMLILLASRDEDDSILSEGALAKGSYHTKNGSSLPSNTFSQRRIQSLHCFTFEGALASLFQRLRGQTYHLIAPP